MEDLMFLKFLERLKEFTIQLKRIGKRIEKG
jgi:hypothetical protein